MSLQTLLSNPVAAAAWGGSAAPSAPWFPQMGNFVDATYDSGAGYSDPPPIPYIPDASAPPIPYIPDASAPPLEAAGEGLWAVGLGVAAAAAAAGVTVLVRNEMNKNPKHSKSSQIVSGQSSAAKRNESAVTKQQYLPNPVR